MTSGWRYTTIDCIRRWRWYPRVGRAEIVSAINACTRGAVVAIPLALPGAAFKPAFAPAAYSVPPTEVGGYGGAAFVGPAYAPYGVAGGLYADQPYQRPIASEGVQPMLSGDVPHFLPDRQPVKLVDSVPVPEPESGALLACALVAVVAVMRWVKS